MPSKQSEEIRSQLRAQRYPEACWLYVPNYRSWQKHTKPAPAWMAFDCGLLTDPAKRRVWEAQGPQGLSVWLGVLVAVGQAGVDGLVWGDPRYLAEQVPDLETLGLDWIIEAEWAVYLTREQAAVIRAGGTLDDLLEADNARQKEVFTAIAEALTREYGPPRTSRRSEALYWRPKGKRGQQVRLAMHKRRRSGDTVCDVIVHPHEKHHSASDIEVPLDKPVDPDWLVEQIVRWVDAAGVNGGNGDGSLHRRSGPKKGGRSAQCALNSAQGSPPDRGFSRGNGDSLRSAQNTGQDSDRDSNNDRDNDRDPRQGDSPSGTHSARANSGCGGRGGETRQDSTAPQTTGRDRSRSGPHTGGRDKAGGTEARQPGNPHEPETGGTKPPPQRRQARKARRRRGGDPVSLKQALPKAVWRDPEAVAFGETILNILWPGRPADTAEAQSEIGSFGQVFIEEVKARLPPEQWDAAKEKAYETARHVHKHKGARRPGGEFLDVWRRRMPARASPG